MSDTAQTWMSKRFLRSASLPRQVFQDAGDLGFLFTDAAVLTAPDLWKVLDGLGERFRDISIAATVIQDRQVDAARSGALPSVQVARNSNGGDELRNWLNLAVEGRPEPLYIYAKVTAITGGSLGWGLWCDQDQELAVLGVPVEVLGPVREWVTETVDWPWYDAGEIAELLGAVYYPDPVPQNLIRQIRQSFAVARI